MAKIQGLNNLNKDLETLKKDVSPKPGSWSKAMRGLKDALKYGEMALRAEYSAAKATGVENTSNIFFGTVINDRGGVVMAKGKGLFFAEFGTGILNNSGSKWGRELGYVPKSWSVSENGKGFLAGSRYEVFGGYWPVPKKTPNAELKEFISHNGETFTRYVVPGHPPVNATEKAAKEMRKMALQAMATAFKKK